METISQVMVEYGLYDIGHSGVTRCSRLLVHSTAGSKESSL